MELNFKWDGSLAVGVDYIDSQHEFLFHMLEDIIAKYGDQEKVPPKVFTDLLQYAENHFIEEEEYMLSIAFPQLEEHIKLHQEFIEDIIKLSHTEKSKETISFVYLWLMKHIGSDDMAYFDYAVERAKINV